MAAETTHTAQEGWLLCRAESHLCALSLADVVEIMRPLLIEPLATAPVFVLGLSIIRGQPVPVVHVGLLLGGRDAACGRLVTIRTGGRVAALAVESVLGVLPSAVAELKDLPPLVQAASQDGIAAIGLLDRELLLFLDAARTVPESLMAGLGAA